MYEEEIPSHVKDMSKDQRIRWHSRRIKKEEPAFTLVESLKTSLTTGELKQEINDTKEYMIVISERIALLQSTDFKKLQDELIRFRIKLKLLRKRKKRLLKVQSSGMSVKSKLLFIKGSEDITLNKLDGIFRKLYQLYVSLDLVPPERKDVLDKD